MVFSKDFLTGQVFNCVLKFLINVSFYRLRVSVIYRNQ